MTSWITVCDTCKREDWAPGDGPTDGARLAELIEDAATTTPTVQVRRHSCLMGCVRACNVTIQGADKLNYTLGDFEPNTDVAKAIVHYAQLHADSETGQVPYRTWPQPVKGHFVSRHLPLPKP